MAQSSRSSSSSKGRNIPKFVNRPPNPDTVKRRAENRGGRFDSIFKDGFDAFRPKDGENAVRFLPPTWEGEEGMDYAYEIWVHAFVGPDDSTYLCPWKMNDKPCPLCDAARDSKKSGEEDEYKKLEVKQQFVAWVIDRNSDEDTPLLYQMSRNIDKDISGIRENKRGGGYLWVSHTEEGYDLYFKRTGAGLKTRYSAWSFDRSSSPISDDRKTQESVMEYIQDHPIPDILKFYDSDYLEKVASGTVVEKDEDADNGDERNDRDDRDDKDNRSERGRRGRDGDRDDDDRSSRRRSEREDSEGEEARSEHKGKSSRSVPRERERPAPDADPEDGNLDADENEGDRRPSGRDRDRERGSSRDRDSDRKRSRDSEDIENDNDTGDEEGGNPLPDEEEEGHDRRRNGRDRDRDERPRGRR